MKKLFFILLLPIAFTLFFSTNANAATQFDGLLHHDPLLQVSNPDDNYRCTLDGITQYAGWIQNKVSTNNDPILTEVWDQYQTNAENGKGWSLMNFRYGSYPGYGCMSAFSVFDPNGHFYFGYNEAGDPTLKFTGSYLYYIEFQGEAGNFGATKTPNNYWTQQSGTSDVWNLSAPNNMFFQYINGDITYPEGYEGTIMPATGGPVEKPDLSPKFNYTVSNKDVAAQDDKQELPTYTPDEGYYFKGYNIIYYLFKCESGWDNQLKLCMDGDIKNTQSIPIGEQYKYSVTDYGDYMLEAEYTATECYRYPSYPATPDNCYLLTLGNVFEDYEFHSTNVYLKIDGKTFGGHTAGLECDASGYCEPKDDGLGMFRALDGIDTFGLQQFFTAPIDFYGTLASKVDSCTPITVPFMNTSFQLTCMKQNYYNWSPTIMLLYTTIMIATTGYLIAFNIFRTIKNLNTPDHDGIEVAKL